MRSDRGEDAFNRDIGLVAPALKEKVSTVVDLVRRLTNMHHASKA